MVLPSVEGSRDIGDDDRTRERRDDGIKIGIDPLGKPQLRNWKSASRRVQSEVFKKEFLLLEDILYNFWIGDDDEGHKRCAIDKDKYVELLKLLQRKKEAARDSFIFQGLSVLKLPSWGQDFAADSFLTINDFEVVSICFRAEVEYFCSRIDYVHNFDTGRARKANSSSSDEDDELYDQQNSESISGFRRDAPPHISRTESEEVAEIVIGGSSMRKERKTSDISAIRKTQSAHLRYRDDVERFLTTRKENKLPKNAKIREVMQGRNEGDSEGAEHRDKDDRMPRKPSPLRESISREDSEESNDKGERERKKPSRRKLNTGGQPPDDDPSDGSDSGKPARKPSGRRLGKNTGDLPRDTESATKEPQFDLKLKIESVPRWNGDTDNIVKWFARINDIATLSKTIHKQLGRVVPKRLEGPTETWYFSLPTEHRSKIERDWDSLKEALGAYYMNRRWLDRQKSRANRAYYHESGYFKELPSEYVIRKAELLRTVYTMDDTELIMEIMEGAPTQWNTVLTTQLYQDIVEFQNAIHFHEDTLVKLGHERRERYDSDRFRDCNYARNDYRAAHTRLVGWSKNLPPPKFPKDDSNVSKRATPKSKGARPC